METDTSRNVDKNDKNDKIENIDIEKHKELFEYEMTEVIYALKGEFATYSGKGTRFAEINPGEEKLTLSTPEFDPSVEVAREKLEMPEVAEEVNFELNKVEIESSVVELPDTPSGAVEFKAPELEAQKLEVPEAPLIDIQPMKKAELPEKFAVELPDAQKPAGFCSVSEGVELEAPSVQLPSASLPEIREFTAETEAVNIELPETSSGVDFALPSGIEGSVSVDVPEYAKALPVDVRPKQEMPEVKVSADVPAFRPYEKKAVELAPVKSAPLPDTTLPEPPQLPKEKAWKPIEPPEVHAELPDFSAIIENIIELAKKR